MPTRSLPPEGLSELVEAYANTAQAVLDLGLTCRPEDFDRETQAPGWTVKDHISHVVGVESALAGNPDPEVEVPDHPWIRHEMGRFLEQSVQLRRDRPGSEVVNEWKHVLPRRLRALRDPELTIDTEVAGPLGDGSTTLGELLRLRIIDIWVHEQDLREALDRPGNLDSPAAAEFVARVLRGFPRRAALAGLEPGTSVIIESTGPVLAREGVRITPKSDGSVWGEPLFSGQAHVDETDETTGEVIVVPPGSITTIRLTTEALTRRGAGRVPTAQLRYSVEGDEDVAARVLDELAITP
ncbi:maleylpyruvate isomerase family mycothiol-dependent enzyme [Flexivirga sp. ID2601S]|uniref:Maleylpyruvate isomerase family mycothiol-dependent enzyme n=1 Tax=Flexivirga aerilata TaxID=1656889 RepID=A0A849AJR0_9MICO|nr:maleylpyruvate isomerase family mycothiol-dependent enzyme [Flexivirga aerilata]NNG38630.1 maleylpyruvate isomerase family mycothiol-dependent enzyme [Flexivirga aerilata]